MASFRSGYAYSPLPPSRAIPLWQRRKTKRILLGVASAVILTGAGLLVYPLLSDWNAERAQDRLAAEFGSAEFKWNFGSGLQRGKPMSRIEIPSIGLNTLVVEGTGQTELKAGAGHYTKTALPCEAGNVAIAGHRSTYGKPFGRLDELKPGDTIKLSTPLVSCTYRIVILDPERTEPRPNRKTAAWITKPNNISLLDPTPGSMLTLTTCHPKGSAEQRLVIRAEMVVA